MRRIKNNDSKSKSRRSSRRARQIADPAKAIVKGNVKAHSSSGSRDPNKLKRDRITLKKDRSTLKQPLSGGRVSSGLSNGNLKKDCSTSTATTAGLTVTDDVRIEQERENMKALGIDKEFELMKVKVTLLGLTGIIGEKVELKKKRKSKTTNNNRKKEMRGLSIVSSLSERDDESCNDSVDSLDASENDSDNAAEIFASVAFKRNVNNNKTTIATHIPSLSMGKPVTSIGHLSRYAANWPVEEQPFLPRKGETDSASYTFTRVMMREPYMGSDGSKSISSNFASETIDLHISLKEGKELIPVGIASITITGNEEGAELMNVPAKAVTYCKNGKKMILGSLHSIRRRKLFKNSKNDIQPSFSSNPTKIYRLDENASLSVMVKVLPNHAVEAIHHTQTQQIKNSFLSARDDFRNEISCRERQRNNAAARKENEEDSRNQFKLSIFSCMPGATKLSTPKKTSGSVGILCGGGFLGDQVNTSNKSNSSSNNNYSKSDNVLLNADHNAVVEYGDDGLPVLTPHVSLGDHLANVAGSGDLIMTTSSSISSVSESTSSSCSSVAEDQTNKVIHIVTKNTGARARVGISNETQNIRL